MFGHYCSLFLFYFFYLKFSTGLSITEGDYSTPSSPVTDTTEPSTPILLTTLSKGKKQSDTTCVPPVVQEQKCPCPAQGTIWGSECPWAANRWPRDNPGHICVFVPCICSSSAHLSGPCWGEEIKLCRAWVQLLFSADCVAMCMLMSHLFLILLFWHLFSKTLCKFLMNELF